MYGTTIAGWKGIVLGVAVIPVNQRWSMTGSRKLTSKWISALWRCVAAETPNIEGAR
jgi:hypothetical protein